MRLGELRLAHGNLLAQGDYCARKFSFWTVYFSEELTEGLERDGKGCGLTRSRCRRGSGGRRRRKRRGIDRRGIVCGLSSHQEVTLEVHHNNTGIPPSFGGYVRSYQKHSVRSRGSATGELILLFLDERGVRT
jgi:hypothetical protein